MEKAVTVESIVNEVTQILALFHGERQTTGYTMRCNRRRCVAENVGIPCLFVTLLSIQQDFRTINE